MSGMLVALIELNLELIVPKHLLAAITHACELSFSLFIVQNLMQLINSAMYC